MENTKTVKEWIESIEDEEVRSKALNNMNSPFLSEETYSLQDALLLAFIWKDSAEGHEYWKHYYSSI